MIRFGIRLHDVNTALPESGRTLEARLKQAKAEGFSCVHLAFSKVMKDVPSDACALTEGFARYVSSELEAQGMDLAVLGCYLNLAHPDPAALQTIQKKYYAHLRAASLMRASVVGTETGAPNAEYRSDAYTHSPAALSALIRGLEPVVECAEHYGVSMAIEPVWKHIVYDAARARQVLDAIASPNLRIIFDPVNLLSAENADDRERIFGETMDLLADEIAVVHLKDYRRQGSELVSVAAGTGEMDYSSIMKFLKARKPFIQATLENTSNDNAESSRLFLQQVYDSVN